jgi:hypothetical protein
MPVFRDLTGQIFGRFTVLQRAENSKSGMTRWHCLCVCGKKSICIGNNLVRGISKSCGCFRMDNPNGRKHGHTAKRKKTPEYRSWRAMRNRCNNPHSTRWENYGGRGISICERWSTFENFYADLGEKPEPKHLYSLDRWPDMNGNYEPGNCRWATDTDQARNKRSVKLTVEKATEIRSLRASGVQNQDLAKQFGIHAATVSDVINNRSWNSLVAA